MTPDDSISQSVSFEYEKARGFRVIHVDGAHGGIAPNGNGLAVSFYSERRPIPQREVFQISNQGVIPQSHETRNCDIMREVEICAIMNIAVAKSLHEWLGSKIAEYDEIKASIAKNP